MGNRASAPDGVPTESPSTSGRDAHVRARLADAPETYRDPSAYATLGALGVGALGSVTLVRRRATDEAFALKRYAKSDLVATDRVAVAARELAVMRTLQPHPRVITLLAHFQDETSVYFLLPHLPGGSLADLLRRPRTRRTPHPTHERHHPLPAEDARAAVACVVLALEHLRDHRPPIAHRDVKPENLLLDHRDRVVLADFGLARAVPAPSAAADDDRCRTQCGAAAYISPEMARGPEGPGHGWETDWWGLGVVAHELLTGTVPFRDANVHRVYAALLGCGAGVETRSSPVFTDVEPAAADFVADALRSDPRRRLGCARRGRRRDAKRHPWFRGFDFDALVEGTAPAATIRGREAKGETSGEPSGRFLFFGARGRSFLARNAAGTESKSSRTTNVVPSPSSPPPSKVKSRPTTSRRDADDALPPLAHVFRDF
jgi:serine/threonine protein kinase